MLYYLFILTLTEAVTNPVRLIGLTALIAIGPAIPLIFPLYTFEKAPAFNNSRLDILSRKVCGCSGCASGIVVRFIIDTSFLPMAGVDVVEFLETTPVDMPRLTRAVLPLALGVTELDIIY